MVMRIWRTDEGAVIERDGIHAAVRPFDWDALFRQDDPIGWTARQARSLAAQPLAGAPAAPLAPIASQEVWAAGVTYLRSRSARMEESAATGGADFYDRVYGAARPELFFKATSHRMAAPGRPVRIRQDARWNVPEPELAVCVNSAGRAFGFTVGNDMSSRDIEAENPLYLPQAKVFDGCCALGPCVLLRYEPLGDDTEIAMQILRGGLPAFSGTTQLKRMKRTAAELVEFLFREDRFPNGVVLLTGTGIVPPPSFSLCRGDEVRIAIEPIGTLVNPVA